MAVSVFVLSTTLNYLDRSLSGVLASLIKAELVLNNQQLGWLISAFSITYAAASLPAGWLLDRLGVNRGISLAIGLWSAACVSTGLVTGAGTMAICRAALGAGEAAGIPAFGKVNAEYLKPEERALGAAVNGIGISVGAALAALSIGMAVMYGWRAPFVMSGFLGFLWIPLWLLVNQRIPQGGDTAPSVRTGWSVLRKGSLQVLVLVNVLWMIGFSLWSNWISVYLMDVHHVTLQQTKSLVWIPPMISNLGGFFGGWLSLRWVKRAVPVVAARKRAVWVSAVGCLSALGLLFVHSAVGATIVISVSFFFVLAGSVNLYALPIDLYGAAKAGLAISALTCAYGMLQAVISPIIGWMGDHHLYYQAIWLVAAAPALASVLLVKVRA